MMVLSLCLLLLADEPARPATMVKDAQLVEVYSADYFFEGPTWDPGQGKLFFTAFAKDQSKVLRLDEPGKATTWLDKSQGINGTYLSRKGTLLAAQGGAKRILELVIGPDGPTEQRVLWGDPDLVAPNDLCQTPDGNIYFTDPDFARRQASAVYLLPPGGRAVRVIADMVLPNGIIASPDGKTLYVSDSFLKHWRSYPIGKDGSLGAGQVFFQPDTPNQSDPDGMTVDERGNLYVSGRGGIWAVSPEGKSLGFLPTPSFCSNLTFGGPAGKTLFLTCDKKVLQLEMTVKGAWLGKSRAP